jgi:hypothetical protein
MNVVVIAIILVWSAFASTHLVAYSWLQPKCTCFQYTYIWVWLGQQNPIPTSWRVLMVMKLLISLCCLVLDSLFTNNCHKLSSIRKHPCASWATNTSCPRFCELWFQMRNAHHRLSHAFLKDYYLVNVWARTWVYEQKLEGLF